MPVAAKKAKRHRGLSGCDWAQAPASQTLCTPNPKGNGSSAQGIPCIRRTVTGLCKRRLGCRPTRSNRFSVLTNKAPCLRDFRSRSIVCEVRVGAAPRAARGHALRAPTALFRFFVGAGLCARPLWVVEEPSLHPDKLQFIPRRHPFALDFFSVFR